MKKVLGLIALSALALSALVFSASAQPYAPIAGQYYNSYPAGSVPVTAHSGDVAASAAAAALPAVAGRLNYITGFQCDGAGATGAATVAVTVAGVSGGTMTYVYTAIAGATLANARSLNVTFPLPVPASAVNTAITVSMPSLGTGNLHAACNAQGYYL